MGWSHSPWCKSSVAPQKPTALLLARCGGTAEITNCAFLMKTKLREHVESEGVATSLVTGFESRRKQSWPEYWGFQRCSSINFRSKFGVLMPLCLCLKVTNRSCCRPALFVALSFSEVQRVFSGALSGYPEAAGEHHGDCASGGCWEHMGIDCLALNKMSLSHTILLHQANPILPPIIRAYDHDIHPFTTTQISCWVSGIHRISAEPLGMFFSPCWTFPLALWDCPNQVSSLPALSHLPTCPSIHQGTDLSSLSCPSPKRKAELR